MSDLTFACTVLKMKDSHGGTVTFQAGDVVRRGGDGGTAWSDCIILGFSRPDKHRDVYVKLARPYAYASCIGTTGPGVLLGCEEFEALATHLRFKQVVSSHPMVSGSGVRPLDRGYDSEVIEMFDA